MLKVLTNNNKNLNSKLPNVLSIRFVMYKNAYMTTNVPTMMPNIRFLESDLDEMNTIFHISDIHIRKRSRHSEYLRVFDRLCEHVNTFIKQNGRKCCILVTGDVMHDKTELVPESIDTLKRFLIKLSDVTEVVMIIGNHDTNIFNKESLDCLTPIIEDLYTKHRIHLLNENAIYVYGAHDVLFGVTTLWAPNVTKIDDGAMIEVKKFLTKKRMHDNVESYTKIALYHGILHGCTLDNGTRAFNSENRTNCSYFNQTDFHDYDMVMLGDVHKHQFLNKARTIAYAGSLIQQKRDEDLLEHGVIRWDIHKRKATFSRIKSDFGMIQITVGSTKADVAKLSKQLVDKYKNTELPENLDVKTVYSSTEGKKLFKKVFDDLTKTHSLVKSTEITNTTNINALEIDSKTLNEMMEEGVENTGDVKTTKTTGKDTKKNIKQTKQSAKPIKLNDDDAVVKIMTEHLERQHAVGEDFEKIKKAMRDEVSSILQDVDYNYESEVKNISLKSISFDNMFIYTEKNKIDFERFENIVGLNASNYKGKSSFIDVVLYSIYGECSRGKRFDVLNIKKKKMNSRVVLDVNGVEYIILRTSFINSTSSRDLKESVTIWENSVNITADDRVKTHQLIAKKICSYEDMINNSFVLQKNGKSFVDLPDKDKKDLLCKMARFDIFDKIFVEAKSRHFSVSQSLGKTLKKLEQYDNYLVKDDEKEDSKKLVKNGKSVKSANSANSANSGRSRRTIINNLEDKIKIIESMFATKMDNILESTDKLERFVNVTEKKIVSLEEQKNSLETKLAVHNVKREMYRMYEDEHREFSQKCKNLIKEFNISSSLQKELSRVTNGKTLTQIEEENSRFLKEKMEMLNNLTADIDSNVKKVVNVDLSNIDVQIEHETNNKTRSHTMILKMIQKEINSLEEKLTESQLSVKNMITARTDLQCKLEEIEVCEKEYVQIDNDYKEKIKCETFVNDLTMKIENATNKMKTDLTKLHDLETHEYDPECEKCMKNPVTKELISTNESIKQNRKHTMQIEREIKGVVDKLKIFDKKNKNGESLIKIKYDRATNLIRTKSEILLNIERLSNNINVEQKDSVIIQTKVDTLKTVAKQIEKNFEIEKKIDDLRKKVEEIESKTNQEYEKVRDLRDSLNEIDTKISKDISHLNKASIIRIKNSIACRDFAIESLEVLFCEERLNTITKDIDDLKKTLHENRTELNSLLNLKLKLEFDTEKFNEIKEEVANVEQRKIVLDYIKKVLDKNGLVDTLLSKNIIPYLQNNINRILSDVGHYQIEVLYKNQSVNIYKKSGDEASRGLNVTMSSGYESYLLDLVFRLALVQINNHIKTNFLVIDEGFNACDSDNKANIKELLEFMREYYSWILIVSHDEFIKSFYDMNIVIQSLEDGSCIQNVDVDDVNVDDVGIDNNNDTDNDND